MGSILASVVVFCLILLCNGLQEESINSNIYMIDEDLHTYTFSCATSQLVALSSDQKSLLFYDVNKWPPSPTSIVLPLPGELLQVSEDGHYVAVTHDSYLSVVGKAHDLKTYSITVVKASSIVIIEGLACLVPAFDQSTNIQCLKMDSGNTSTCDYSIYAGALAFANVAKGWVYIIDQGLSPQSMHKFSVSTKAQCLDYVHDNSDFGTYDYGQHLWFSYDGNRIFLDNGLTLTSSDDNSDMKPHGDFNSSYEMFYYSYFSQSNMFPYTIAGIRSNTNHTVHHYSWPYLQPLDSKSIPAPSEDAVYGAEQVHVCGNTTYVIAKYRAPGKGTKIGVVTNF